MRSTVYNADVGVDPIGITSAEAIARPGDELRALRRLHREAGAPRHGPVFVTERGTAFTRDGINKQIARAGEAAGFGYRVHPHMLRHACGLDEKSAQRIIKQMMRRSDGIAPGLLTVTKVVEPISDLEELFQKPGS